ncbi:DegV family protein [Chloroflexota bacterium]
MQNVAIVTDTTACIPLKQVMRYDITIVPMKLIFEGTAYRDRIDIRPAEFYNLLRQAKKLPTTSNSSPDHYFEAYVKTSQRTKSILCITESSKLSTMFKTVHIVMEMAKFNLPNIPIEALECTTAAAG